MGAWASLAKREEAMIRARTVESLRQEAAEWLGGAELHFSEAQAQNDDGNLETAIEQTRFAEAKLATARLKMIEARKLEAMETGS